MRFFDVATPGRRPAVPGTRLSPAAAGGNVVGTSIKWARWLAIERAAVEDPRSDGCGTPAWLPHGSAGVFCFTSTLNFPFAHLRSRLVSANTFVHQHRVTYADCTVGNHVYYANYLHILEAARGEFFRSLGSTLLKWQETGFMFPVVEAHLRYKTLARYDDLLQVEVWVTVAERVRLNFAYRITNQTGALVLEGETLHVCMNLEEKLKRLPDEFAAAMKPHLRPAAAGG